MAARNGPFPGGTVFATVFLLLFAAVFAAHAQSLSNLRIGDGVSRLSLLGSESSATDHYKTFSVRKWNLPSGNELSVTTSHAGRIVYLESDWGARNDDPACDLPGLKFGVTTLGELRKRFGSNGFGFQHRDAVVGIQGGLVMVNSYEAGTNVVTFITKVTEKEFLRLKRSGQSAAIADHSKLDGISIAEAEYANGEWGDRIYDPKYKKIRWR